MLDWEWDYTHDYIWLQASKLNSLKQHKNSSMFVEGFEFEEDGGEAYAWDLSDSVEWATRSEVRENIFSLQGNMSLCVAVFLLSNCVAFSV